MKENLIGPEGWFSWNSLPSHSTTCSSSYWTAGEIVQMSNNKRKKSTAAPLRYKESILISMKNFHQLLTGKKKDLPMMMMMKPVIRDGNEQRRKSFAATTMMVC